MVISSGVFHCDELDGYAAINEREEIVGLITYTINKQECEIISLDSLVENKGIGTSLLKKVEEKVLDTCKLVKVITTNDNIRALAFYQKRGYRLVHIFSNAVEEARKVKPQIPLIADNGIAIRDELLFEKLLIGSNT